MRAHVLIVGAGLGGLSAAAVLLERGYSVRVYEQAPALGEIGAGIQISANASKALHALDLEPSLREVAVTPIAFHYRLYSNGELLHEIPLKSEFESWHPDVQTLIDAMDKDQCYRWAMYDRAPVTGWSTPRVTLLGDAAHPTLPFMAQGAAMAIEDGVILARALEQTRTIDAALALYQQTRYERTARVQLGSAELGELYHLRTEAELRRGFADRNIAKERGQWLYSYDPLTAPLGAPAKRLRA